MSEPRSHAGARDWLARHWPMLETDRALARTGGAAFRRLPCEDDVTKNVVARAVRDQALEAGFAAVAVHLDACGWPRLRLHRLYARACFGLRAAGSRDLAFRAVLDRWLASANDLLPDCLASLADTAPTFATGVRAYAEAGRRGNARLAEQLAYYLGGGYDVVEREVSEVTGASGPLDAATALELLRGWLVLLADADHAGLVVVLAGTVRGDPGYPPLGPDDQAERMTEVALLVDAIEAGHLPRLVVVWIGK